MKKFRTLNLAYEFYNEVKEVKLRQPFKGQFERALLSIPLNLAEGSAKPTQKDRRKFYFIALASFRETCTLLELTGHQKLLQDSVSDSLGAHLYKLCHSLKSPS